MNVHEKLKKLSGNPYAGASEGGPFDHCEPDNRVIRKSLEKTRDLLIKGN